MPTPGGGATFRVDLPAAAPMLSDDSDDHDEIDHPDQID